MIKEFKENEIRASGIINRGMFEQVKMLYQDNPEIGGELAVSLMEFILTGDFSSDNFMVKFAMANHKEVVVKNQERYDAKKEAKQEAIESGLREIAELLNAGMKQVDIARKLNMQPPNVSKKVAKIRKEFPWLLEAEDSKKVSTERNLETLGNVSKVANLPEEAESEEIVAENLESFIGLGNISKVSNVAEISGNMESQESSLETSVDLEIVSKFPSFQNFHHVNYNVNDNVNVNGLGNPSGIPASGGKPPHPQTASPTVEGSKYRRKFEF